jgi:hypothetical protein
MGPLACENFADSRANSSRSGRALGLFSKVKVLTIGLSKLVYL